MNDTANPLGVPHGLYYVNRANSEAYVLSGAEIPPMDPVERAVLAAMFSAAKTNIARVDIPGCPKAGPVESGGAPNLLGQPFGMYYVTLDGQAAYSMAGPDAPGLRQPELSVATALVYHAHTVLHRERLVRGEEGAQS